MSGYRPPTFDASIDLDLSRNEGRPSITSVDFDPDTIARLTSRYPDTTELTQLVAGRHGVPVQQVLVTAGGDDALFRCFLRERGPVVATTPSFEMIARYAAQLERPLDEVPWWDGEFPVDDFLSREAEMAVVVSPNNPTGSVIDEVDLRKLAGAFQLLVLDAAYSEFADTDLTPAALELNNVVVVRTLSKAFGLAGLRVGYLLGSAELVSELGEFGSPYSLSALSAGLAADVLSRESSDTESIADDVAHHRERLVGVLDDLAAEPLPSQGNFVLASAVDPDWVVSAAASLGVGLRRFPDRQGLESCVRITVPGAPRDMDRLEQTLRTVLEPQALLFDLDGVLADVSESFRESIIATASLFGVTVTPGEVATAKAAGNAADDWELTRRLLALAGVEVPYEEVRDQFETIYQGDATRVGLKQRERLLPDRGFLATWSERMPLGVVTARPRKDAEEFLERFEIARYFETVVTREDAPSKPDPAPVRLALDRLGVSRAWMLGDTRDDLDSARGAGVVPIGVAVPGDDVTALSSAARIVGSANEIQEVLDVTKS